MWIKKIVLALLLLSLIFQSSPLAFAQSGSKNNQPNFLQQMWNFIAAPFQPAPALSTNNKVLSQAPTNLTPKSTTSPIPVVANTDDLSKRVSSLELAVQNLPASQPTSLTSNTPTTTALTVTGLAAGTKFVDLIGSNTIIDSFGNIYPSGASQTQTNKPTLGTPSRKYFGIYANNFTVPVGGLTNGPVRSDSNGTLSNGNINLSSEVSNTLGPGNGGTGQSTYITGDILYSNGTNSLGKLNIGSANQVLTIVGGVPTWQTSGSSSCPTCVVTNPSAAQTLTAASSTTGLSLAQASTAGAADVFNVTNNAGSTKFLAITSAGNTTLAGTLTGATGLSSSGTITFSGLSTNGPVFTSAGGVLNSEAQLAVSRGGTGAATLTANGILQGNGTSAVSAVAPGANGSLLVSNGTTASFGTITNSSLTAGSFTNITGVGTLTAGTWNAGVVGPTYGGTGVNGSAAGNGTLLIGNGSGFTLAALTQGTGMTITNGSGTITIASTQACPTCLQQAPTTTAANTVTPTTASVVGLTVNATNSTAANTANFNQSQGGADAVDVNVTNTAGTNTNGLLVNVNGSGGTTPHGVNVTQAAGTVTNGVTVSGTITNALNFVGASFTKLINSTNLNVTNTGNITGGTYNGLTVTSSTGTLTVVNGKTLTVNKTLTLDGTDSTTMTFPAATDTIAGLGATQTFTGAKTFNAGLTVGNNSSLTISSGTGQFVQTYSNSAASNAQALAFSNTNTGAGVAINGVDITPTNTSTASSGTNTLNIVQFEAGGALGGTDTSNGINFASATGYTNFIKTPTANLSSAGALTGLTGLTVASGGETITAGGLTVTARDVAITAGNLTLGGTQRISNAGAAAFTTISATGQITSTLASGTAPFSITSTTPVANLTTVPTTYNAAGTQQTAAKLVTGTATLSGGTVTVTLSGSAVYTGAGTYQCTGTDQTAINAVRIANTNGTTFVITGTTTDVIGYICLGN